MLKLVLLSALATVAFGATIPSEQVEKEEYIIGGKDTDISQVPYVVALYSAGSYVCQGAILTPRVIITTAKCADSIYRYTIRAGSSRIDSGGVKGQVLNMWSHPKSGLGSFDYNVAIIELAAPLPFSSTIQPIKLATSEPTANAKATIAGWGAVDRNGTWAKTLQSAVIPIVDHNACETFFEQLEVPVTVRMICAGGTGKPLCYRDGGTPLVVNGRLAGIASHGGFCNGSHPEIYTNIADYDITAFIEKFIED